MSNWKATGGESHYRFLRGLMGLEFEGPRGRPKGGERKLNEKSFQELAYVPKLKLRATSVLEGDESTFQQQKNDPNKIMKLAEEEWDQPDLRLTNYAQNNHQTFLLKMSSGHV
jgi:hypothetical protein